MIIRISKGRYKPDLHAEVTARLDRSAATLVPPIRALPGCLGFYAGADDTSNTLVNVSVWDSLEHAKAMDSLPEMAVLNKESPRWASSSNAPSRTTRFCGACQGVESDSPCAMRPCASRTSRH